VLIQPDPVLLEALRVSALQSLNIGAPLEPFAEAARPKSYQPKEPETVAIAVVSHVRQFMRDDGSFAFLGSSEERGRRIQRIT
jgi:hypothetical protein